MKKIRLLGCAPLLFVCFTTGCMRLSLHKPIRSAVKLPESIGNKLVYPNVLTNLGSYEFTTNGSYTRWFTDISVYAAHYPTNETVTLEIYSPHTKEPVPIILLLPISGGKKYELERFLAPYFAKRGMAAAIVHREKRPKVPTAEEMNHLMHQAILRNKQVIDWVETQKEFDSKRIGVLGTSMGGINGAMLVGVDSRINSAVLALAGCDIPYILAKSKDRGVQRYQKTYMGEHGVSSDEMYEQLKMLLEWDPKNLAPYVDPGRELLILGVCDKVVPFKKGMELRRAMGGPETKLVLSGHYTAVLYIFDIRHSAYQFFKKKFKE